MGIFDRLYKHKRPDPQKSIAALQRSEEALARVRARDVEVTNAVRSLREVRSQNHFAERMRAALRGEA